MKRLGIFILVLLWVGVGFAQTDYYKFQFKFGLGSSYLGAIVHNLDLSDLHNTPVFLGSFDVNINRSVGFGVTLASQKFVYEGSFDTIATFSLYANKLNFSINDETFAM
jgi:hypothetical protein